MQNPLELLEANVRPTWHGNSSARTGGRGLNDCGKKDAASSRCYLDPLISSYHSCCPFLPFLSLFRFSPHWFVYLQSLWLPRLVTYLCPFLPFLSLFRFSPHWFVYLQSLWLTRLVTYLCPLIVLVLGVIRPWSHPTPDRPRNPRHQESWNYTPLLRHTRRVLVTIDLEQVQHLMSEHQSDVMQATTCDALPSLGRLEQ